MNTVYLNTLGITNALGRDRESVYSGLLAGRTDGMVARRGWVPGRTVTVGEVTTDARNVSHVPTPYCSRNNRLLEAAVRQIEPAIRATIRRFGAQRVAIVLGTSTSGIAEGEEAIRWHQARGRLPETYDYRQQELSGPSEYLRRRLGTEGPAWTVSTACTSSAKALASARRLLRMGLCDAVVTGGVDTLCGLTLNGFTALESVSSALCNPFSASRDGINIGEGAAVFLMTREHGPVALLGVGESSDAYHISGPDPEGTGARLAIREALEDAGLDAGEIDYINLHGTGTVQNDAMEARVVDELFAHGPAVSSTKPLVGHTLGAAGATEAAFCWMLLQAAATQRPPHVWDGRADPDIPRLNFSHSEMRAAPCRHALSNSFAFGGNNACLVMGKTA
ncbi:MAG: beta-ketoacyl-[acyl-carrier-protein] synthase family protein [Gammaproteobacteria bacterium]|jgi:3-oxoacyl-[acyl-carrier-protein] synthase-1